MNAIDGLARRRRLARRRAASGHPRYIWEDSLGDYAGFSADRYTTFSEIDRLRAVPFDMPVPPDRAAVMKHIRLLVGQLDGALDEGTGGVLDRTIEAWTGRWIATVETEYVDHCALINLLRCQAAEWVRETTVKLKHAYDELDQLRGDYLAVAERLRRDAIAELGSDREGDQA